MIRHEYLLVGLYVHFSFIFSNICVCIMCIMCNLSRLTEIPVRNIFFIKVNYVLIQCGRFRPW